MDWNDIITYQLNIHWLDWTCEYILKVSNHLKSCIFDKWIDGLICSKKDIYLSFKRDRKDQPNHISANISIGEFEKLKSWKDYWMFLAWAYTLDYCFISILIKRSTKRRWTRSNSNRWLLKIVLKGHTWTRS